MTDTKTTVTVKIVIMAIINNQIYFCQGKKALWLDLFLIKDVRLKRTIDSFPKTKLVQMPKWVAEKYELKTL